MSVITYPLTYSGVTWTFCQDETGYYAISPTGMRRDFASRDEIRAMCESYVAMGWHRA